MDLLTIVLLILFLLASALDIILFIWIRYFYLEPKVDNSTIEIDNYDSQVKQTVEAVQHLVTKVDSKNSLAQQDAELIDALQGIDSIKKLVN